MFGDWKRDCSASTLVDSAEPGSQAWASFFSAPVSLPASGPATATMISQKISTAHLVRRPLAMPTIARARVMVDPPDRSAERGCLTGCTMRHGGDESQDISRLAEPGHTSPRRAEKYQESGSPGYRISRPPGPPRS